MELEWTEAVPEKIKKNKKNVPGYIYQRSKRNLLERSSHEISNVSRCNLNEIIKARLRVCSSSYFFISFHLQCHFFFRLSVSPVWSSDLICLFFQSSRFVNSTLFHSTIYHWPPDSTQSLLTPRRALVYTALYTHLTYWDNV